MSFSRAKHSQQLLFLNQLRKGILKDSIYKENELRSENNFLKNIGYDLYTFKRLEENAETPAISSFFELRTSYQDQDKSPELKTNLVTLTLVKVVSHLESQWYKETCQLQVMPMSSCYGMHKPSLTKATQCKAGLNKQKQTFSRKM